MEEDTYQYPIYFDGPSLDKEKRRKIKNYFHIRRKSGGGDCSSVTNINDKVCCLTFKQPDAQQRVLQKSAHVLEFADGRLVLMVRSSPEPAIEPLGHNLDSASTQGRESLTTIGEEYEIKVDSFLLGFLKESPKAEKDLKRGLSALDCSAQLYPDEGKVLVKCFAQPSAVAEARNWKAKVDQLFDGYKNHYEVNPHKIKAVIQSCSSPQTTDEVKVYSDVGMAVVVGGRSQVNARLMDLQESHGTCISQRQKTIRELGQAKLCLLWNEIEHCLGRGFPGVKVVQGDPGQIILEGSPELILKAGEWISDLEKLVFERKVSNRSPYFFAFLKKTFGGRAELGNFLGVDRVELELHPTEIRLFTLCAEKLNETEKQLHEKIKEVKVCVPNCSAVPSELQEKLMSKTKKMNQGQSRAQVIFGSDNTVCLLGHTKEVEELHEILTHCISDQASINNSIVLPFLELMQLLPELLQLHSFDYSGVIFHPLPFASASTVLLEGPVSKVTDVRKRLGPFLNSLVQDRVTIDLPGAARYFSTPSGGEKMLSVAHSHKCLIRLVEQPHSSRQDGRATVASYSLCDRLQVLVCHGDITKLDADALVNASNEDLKHIGGVAAALSKAGGPEVQKESSELSKKMGKFPVGEVVMTTGGNLNCKKLLHAIGPKSGNSGGRERALLEKTVWSALNLAELMGFKSIAIPCISSGLFGVPVSVCSEAIVAAVREFGTQGGRSLERIILIDTRGEVVRALQETCDRLLKRIPTENITSDLGSQIGDAVHVSARGATGGAPVEAVHVEITQGTIQTQQVDCMVSPMIDHDLLSTRVGNNLSSLIGPQLNAEFKKEAGGPTLPGHTVLVKGLPPLQTKGVFFLNLIPWDNNQHGTAIQVLRQGFRNILDSCDIRGFRSIAVPVIGTGAVLRFPHSVISKVLLEEIRGFEQSRARPAFFLVRIVVHPKDKESSKAFQSSQETIHLRGFTNNTNPDQASFYRHVSESYNEVTATLGGVTLQLVLGDIIHERTDVIINTTDFSNNHFGVSKAILKAAGAAIQAELRKFGTPSDLMCATGPGMLGCRKIIHAAFECEPQKIRKQCKKILMWCEHKGFHSVSFPAINTGVGNVDWAKACVAMLDGMTSAIMDLKPKSLSIIHIVILHQPLFQAFRSELDNRFGQLASGHLTLGGKAKQMFMSKFSRTSSTSAPQDPTLISVTPPPTVISVILCRPNTVSTIKRDLEGILQKQLVERELNVNSLSRLYAMELEAMQAKLRDLDVCMEYRRGSAESSSRGGEPYRSGTGGDVYVLKGLKEDVLSILEIVNRAIQKAIDQDLQEKEEAKLALKIQGSIQQVDEDLQKLSLQDNLSLQEAPLKRKVFVDATAPDGMALKVNLKACQAKDSSKGIAYKVTRNETDTVVFEMPSQWEPMQEESFKKVELQMSSEEYKSVARGFLQTAKFTILKIERVQNRNLWNAYVGCRRRILGKNGGAELRQKSLYHGISAESCRCIEKNRFDWSFAGENGAAYGKGVVFAVDANFSASEFAKVDSAGVRRLFVACVLTGRYTVGNPSMKAAPPRSSDPADCFDSLVDNLQQPSMFVVFHDNQAYPKYLITFK